MLKEGDAIRTFLMSLRLPPFLRFICALVLGVVLSLAYAPVNQGWIAWFFPAVLVFLLWSIPKVETGEKKAGRKNFWRGFRTAYLVGFGFWFMDVAFVAAVSEQGGGWIAGVGTRTAMAAYLAVFFGLYGGWVTTWGRAVDIQPKSQPALGIIRVSAFHGFMWCGLEWLRGIGRVSFGWDGLGVSFLEQGYVMAQAADLVGVNGLSFIPVFGGCVLVQTLKAFHMEALHGHRRVHWEVVMALLLLAMTFTYGIYRLTELERAETFSVRTLSVQQNVPIAYSVDLERGKRIYEGYGKAMQDAFTEIENRAIQSMEETGQARLELPDIVIFPESALPYPMVVDEKGGLLAGQDNEHFFNEKVRKHGDFLFIMGVNQFPVKKDPTGVMLYDQAGEFYNSMAFFPREFSSYVQKPKNHLMPFGEYLPLSEVGFIEALIKNVYAYSAGVQWGGFFTASSTFIPQPVKIRTEAFSIIPTVCYEDTVSVVVRRYVRPESQLMVNVTNDGWFAGTACAEKHYQNARFRCIEYRRPLVRAANTGVTAVVQLTGSAVHPSGEGRQELRDAERNAETVGTLEGVVEIPREAIFTFYGLIGNILYWAGGGIALIGSRLMR